MARLPELPSGNNGNGMPVDADYAALSNQIAALKADLANITSTIGDMGRQQGASAVEAARLRAEQLKDMSAEQIEALRLRANDAAAQADAFVKERPAVAVGVAAALGFVLGLLTARR